MDINLKNLLFTEAAPTPTEALKSGIAAIGENRVGTDGFVVLVSYDRMVKTINNSADFSFDLSNRAIVGYVGFVDEGFEDLYKVERSAGVNKYGILTYQTVMYTLRENGGWLHSDSSLSDDSWRVWQKMYELSDKNGANVYKAKWLGYWNPELIGSGVDIARGHLKDRAFERAAFKVMNNDLTSEEEVTAALGKFAPMCGNLWAYQLKKPMSQVSAMFDKGKELMALARKKGYTFNDIYQAGENFFHRVY